jgi:hypothetical protein
MAGKIATLEASVGGFRAELQATLERAESTDAALGDRDAEIARLAALLVAEEERSYELGAQLEEAARREEPPPGAVIGAGAGAGIGEEEAAPAAEEALLAEEARKHLQMRVASLEASLSAAAAEHSECMAGAGRELEDTRRLCQARLDEYQTAGEYLEKKLSDYKGRCKILQKTQKR